MATDFEMYAGDVKALAFGVTDTTGSAVTVTGASAVFVIATEPGATALVSKSSAATIVVSGSTVTVPLTETDTANLNGLYWYELEITDTSNNISTNRGRVIVHPTSIA